jgi:opacity protein-like surface antigen
MKKNILAFAFFCLMVGSLSAQIFVGGSVSFNSSSNSNTVGSTTTTDYTSYSFGLSPMVGYELNDQLSVGASIGMNLSGREYPNSNNKSKYSNSTFDITPFVRYTLFEISNVSVFGQGSIGLSFGSNSTSTTNTIGGSSSTTIVEGSTNVFSLGVSPGISYKFSDKISIQAFLGSIYYNNSTSKDNIKVDESSGISSLGFNFSSGLNLGIIYKL